MTSERSGGVGADDPGKSQAEEAQDAGPDSEEAVLQAEEDRLTRKQVLRWKSEGGALHPDD